MSRPDPNVEIVTIGTELLLGQIIDTNSAYIGEKLASIGINVYRKTSIGDNEIRLEEYLKEVLTRVDVVIATGGLGPTVDDVTKKVACKIFKRRLILNERLLEKVKNIFKQRNIEMPESNVSQALVPQGIEIIDNNVGTAVGLIFNENNKILILLPGVPREMKPMFEEGVIPYLRKNLKIENVIVSRILKVWGLSESAVDEKIFDLFVKLSNPTIALLASFSEIKIRITAKANDEKSALTMISDVESQIKDRLGKYIFGKDDETMEKVVSILLVMRESTVSVAESCTGGLISHKLTNVPGSSKYFERGVVVYSNEAKVKLLNVPESLMKTYGAVSKEVAKSMAENIRKISNATIGLSCTGIVGPTGATLGKPVGLVYISLATSQETITEEHRFSGEREVIKERASLTALDLLRSYLLKIYAS